ncbi:MAG: 2-dehydropantoate 2-reductase [Proteobacteria bacterium]|jgi:2-dehydropantoate 2-reductase|nr:2-dehydropantoate 2-reductase [Pseudomonadota bacterium]
MRICIYGAGAIGGYLGCMLSKTDAEISLIARGPHLKAMQDHGLRLVMDGNETVHQLNCTDQPESLAPQDYVIVTLKAHSVPRIVPQIKKLLAPDGAVVTAVNGVPWWYFYSLSGPLENTRLRSVDPDDQQWQQIGPERAIGCVVYPACDLVEPGVIHHIEGNRFTLGEPNGEKTERVLALSKIFVEAGLKAPVRPRIRNDIWIKLWGNLSFNPISALTHATLDTIATEPGTQAVARGMMTEAQYIAESLGVKFSVDIDKRIAGAASVGAHKTSMLQDLEQNRPMEIDALLTVVQEMGKMTKIETPCIDIVLALVIQRAKQAGTYSS